MTCVFARFLDRLEYITFTAYDGIQALELWEKHKPDLVITDIRLPEKSGLELVDTILAKEPNQKIIFISGAFFEEEFYEKYKAYCKIPYFELPLNLHTDLVPAIKRLLEEK